MEKILILQYPFWKIVLLNLEVKIMTVNQHLKTIGQRLRIAREAKNLSTRDVASQLVLQNKKISHATIGNYERGLSLPSEDILSLLAEIYQRKLEWIRGTGLVMQGVRYRSLKSVSLEDKKSFELQAQLWLEAYFYVERKLERSLKNQHPKLKVSWDTTGQQLAEKIRKDYKFDDYPVPSVIRLLENFGIHVIEISTEARIDAFAARLGQFRIVVLNSKLPNDRIRLTASHELAHHLFEDCINGPALPPEEIENRAFEFASYLLIPEHQLKAAFELKSMVRLVQYKERFGISLAAMIYRARRIDLIPQRLYERLWREFSRLGIRENEPGEVAPDRPRRMEALFDAAIGEGLISFKEIADLVGVDEREVIDKVVRAMGGTMDKKSTDDGSSVFNFSDYKQQMEDETGGI
jgi:Zn-dependent peptidase ImmA (M78 family)